MQRNISAQHGKDIEKLIGYLPKTRVEELKNMRAVKLHQQTSAAKSYLAASSLSRNISRWSTTLPGVSTGGLQIGPDRQWRRPPLCVRMCVDVCASVCLEAGGSSGYRSKWCGLHHPTSPLPSGRQHVYLNFHWQVNSPRGALSVLHLLLCISHPDSLYHKHASGFPYIYVNI